MIIVSACLLGENCKYNGGNNESKRLKDLLKDYRIIPVCPEILGGLSTPRKPNEIIGGMGEQVLAGLAIVSDKYGEDNTAMFVRGAEETLKTAKKFNVKYAILKEKSPSCGRNYIYNGTFTGELIEGMGVTAQLLEDNGIRVYNENNIEQILVHLKHDMTE